MKREIAALILWLLLPAMGVGGQEVQGAAAQECGCEGYRLSLMPIIQEGVLLLADGRKVDLKVVARPAAAGDDVRQFHKGLEHTGQGGIAYFAAIDWQSLKLPHDKHDDPHGQAGHLPAALEAGMTMPPVGHVYRGGNQLRLTQVEYPKKNQSGVDYTNRAGTERDDGKLRKVDLPFPAVLWLLGALLIAMTTISRRTHSG